MHSQQVEYFRRRLLIWRGQLLDETGGTINHPYQISEDQLNAMSAAANLASQKPPHQSSDRHTKLLNKIDTALERIETGTYGIEQGLVN
jgi:DnaK suppressor protein